MNLLWDIVLRAQKQGWREEELFFQQAKEYSPFYEQTFSYINETSISQGVIEVNLLYRFAGIFQELLHPEDYETEEAQYEEFRRYLIDILLHMILFSDLRHGLTRREIYIDRLLIELRNGSYWKEAAEDFALIEADRQNRLAALLLTQMETGSSLKKFRKALRILYPNALLYQIKEERKKLILYLAEEENEQRKRTIRLAKDLFLPIGFELRVFWKYHFGIIGVEDTMQLDKIALY